MRQASIDIDACSRRKRVPSISESGAPPWCKNSFDAPVRVPALASRQHFWQPWGAQGYDDTSCGRRRELFDQTYRAEQNAALIGRPRAQRERPRRCAQRMQKEHVPICADSLAAPLAIRRMLSALLPQDAKLARQVQALAKVELARQGVQLTGVPIGASRSPRTVDTRGGAKHEAGYRYKVDPRGTGAAHVLGEKPLWPTLLRSVANREKTYQKHMLLDHVKKSSVPENAADLLLTEPERSQHDSEQMLVQSGRVKPEVGRDQQFGTHIGGS